MSERQTVTKTPSYGGGPMPHPDKYQRDPHEVMRDEPSKPGAGQKTDTKKEIKKS